MLRPACRRVLRDLVLLFRELFPPSPPDPGPMILSTSQWSPTVMKTRATAQFPTLPDDNSDIDHLEVTPTYEGVAGEVKSFPKDATFGSVGVFDGPGHLSASLVYVDADGARSAHPSVAEIDIPDEVLPNEPPPDAGTFGFALEQVPDDATE
jgi:hypothetical protein